MMTKWIAESRCFEKRRHRTRWKRGHVTKSWRGEVDSDGEEDEVRSHESVDSGHIEAVWGTDRSSVAIHKLVYRSSVYFTWINLCIALLFLGAAKGHFVFSKEFDYGTTLWPILILDVVPLVGLAVDLVLKLFGMRHSMQAWAEFHEPFMLGMLGLVLVLITARIVHGQYYPMGQQSDRDTEAVLLALLSACRGLIPFFYRQYLRDSFYIFNRALAAAIEPLMLLAFVTMCFLLCLLAVHMDMAKTKITRQYYGSGHAAAWNLLVMISSANFPDMSMPGYEEYPGIALLYVAFMLVAFFLILNFLVAVTASTYSKSKSSLHSKNAAMRCLVADAAYDLLTHQIDPSSLHAVPDGDTVRVRTRQRSEYGSKLDVAEEVITEEIWVKFFLEIKASPYDQWLMPASWRNEANEMLEMAARILFRLLDGSSDKALSREEFRGAISVMALQLVKEIPKWGASSNAEEDAMQAKDFGTWHVGWRYVSLGWPMRLFNLWVVFFHVYTFLCDVFETIDDERNLSRVQWHSFWYYVLTMCYTGIVITRLVAFASPEFKLRYFYSWVNSVELFNMLWGYVFLFAKSEQLGHSARSKIQQVWVIMIAVNMLALCRWKKSFVELWQTFIRLCGQMLPLVAVLLIQMFAYAVIAVELYRNTISAVSLEEYPYNITRGIPHNTTDESATWPNYWTDCATFSNNKTFKLNNFDNVFRAFCTLFDLLVINNWHVITATHVCAVQDWTPRFFFGLFFVHMALMGTNMVIAVILDNYQSTADLARRNINGSMHTQHYKQMLQRLQECAVWDAQRTTDELRESSRLGRSASQRELQEAQLWTESGLECLQWSVRSYGLLNTMWKSLFSARIEEIFTFEMDTTDFDEAMTSRGLEALLHTIQAAVAHMAEDGSMLFMNHAFMELIGISTDGKTEEECKDDALRRYLHMPHNSMLALFELRCLVMESGDCVTEDLDLIFQPDGRLKRFNVCAFPFANISGLNQLSSVLVLREWDNQETPPPEHPMMAQVICGATRQSSSPNGKRSFKLTEGLIDPKSGDTLDNVRSAPAGVSSGDDETVQGKGPAIGSRTKHGLTFRDHASSGIGTHVHNPHKPWQMVRYRMAERERSGGETDLVVQGDFAATQANLRKMRKKDRSSFNTERLRIAHSLSTIAEASGDVLSLFRGVNDPTATTPWHRRMTIQPPTMGSTPQPPVKNLGQSVEIRASRLAAEKAAGETGKAHRQNAREVLDV